jgi:hypothetical protein
LFSFFLKKEIIMNITKVSRETFIQAMVRNAFFAASRTASRIATLGAIATIAVVALSLCLAGLAQAAPLTWTNGTSSGNWNTTDLNWTNGGPTTYTDGGIDDVFFDGTTSGTVNIQTGGVTAKSMTVSSGTHLFNGAAVTDTLETTPITLSGGTLQYIGIGRLGTGQINVTGNATIQASGTATQSGMNNSSIVVSDGVTLDFQNAVGGGTTPTMAPISGGSIGNPITVRINPAGGTIAYIPSAGSTFIGDIRITDRVYLPTVTSSMFGDVGNKIYGSIEARLNGGGGSIDQDIIATTGNHHWSGGGVLTLNGTVTTNGGELTGGTIRFTKPGNSLGSWSLNQGYVLEFAHSGNIGLSNLGANGPDGAGVGKTIRWVGAGLTGLATTNWTLDTYSPTDHLTGNIDVQDATSTANWTGNWRAMDSLSTTFEKEGAGVLNWSGDSTGAVALDINVNGGTLNINSAVNNLDTINVNSGATLGGNGSLTLASGASVISVNNGGTINPGANASIGTLTVNGGLTLNDGSALTMQLGTTGDEIVVNGLLTGSISTGGITLNIMGESGFTGEYVLLDWQGGSATNLDLSDFNVNLFGGAYGFLSISNNQLLFIRPAPEPASLALVSLGLVALIRRRKTRKV